MSFSFTIRIAYKESYALSLQQLGEAFSQYWLPATIHSVSYEDSGESLTIVFFEHDNEEFMADFVAENLILIDAEGDPLKEVRIEHIDWDGLDKHLSDYYTQKIETCLREEKK